MKNDTRITSFEWRGHVLTSVWRSNQKVELRTPYMGDVAVKLVFSYAAEQRLWNVCATVGVGSATAVSEHASDPLAALEQARAALIAAASKF